MVSATLDLQEDGVGIIRKEHSSNQAKYLGRDKTVLESLRVNARRKHIHQVVVFT